MSDDDADPSIGRSGAAVRRMRLGDTAMTAKELSMLGSKLALTAAIVVAALGAPASKAALLSNCSSSIAEYFVCTVIEEGTARVAKMTVDQLEAMLRAHYSGVPAPAPLVAARCSVTCGQIADAPPELKPYAIEEFFKHNCAAAGFSLAGSACLRP